MVSARDAGEYETDAPAAMPAASSWSDVLAPVIAGAHVRGVADALDRLGLAAVLLDETGRVLHSGSRAEAALNGVAATIEGRLVGSTPRSDEDLRRIVAEALSPCGSDGLEGFTLECGQGGGLDVRVLRFPDAGAPACRHVRAALLLS